MKICTICKRKWEDEYRVCPIDGLALQDAPDELDPNTGKIVGSFQLGDKIADGDTGPIHKAIDPARGPVAVQLVNADLLASDVLAESFQEAVKLSARLQHAHVVRVFGSETDADGRIAVVMEYVSGANLRAYRREHPVDVARACTLARQAGEGLVAAHRLGMLHGALHPTRMMVGTDGNLKVGGFHRRALREGVDAFSVTVENLPYLAPEQIGIIRDVPEPDYRADVYSLGVILYELLAGRLPHEAKDLQELAIILEGAPPLPPSFANTEVSPTLSRVVLKAISKQPSERHSTMEDFLRELGAAAMPMRAPQPHGAPQPDPQYPSSLEDSGIFAGGPLQPRRTSGENLWPESAPGKQQPQPGEGSVFGWFKTRIGKRDSRSESRSRGLLDDSSYAPRSEPRSRGLLDDSSYAPRGRRRQEEFEEQRTVLSGSRRGRKRSRFVETFTNFGRTDFDSTGTGALPRRRFSSRAYVFIAVIVLAFIGAATAAYFIWGGAATGKLLVETIPPGAQVRLSEQYYGTTPILLPDLKRGIYRLHLHLDGYDDLTTEIEVTSDTQKSYPLMRLSNLPAGTDFLPPPVSPPQLLPPPAATGEKPSFEGPFQTALRMRSFFPPASGNAWEILQRWQQADGQTPSVPLEQARAALCRDVETVGQEKVQRKEFPAVRSLLEQVRRYLPDQACGASLQASYDEALSKTLSDLQGGARMALDRQQYVTPEVDCALKYVRLILAQDPQNAEARVLDGEIFTKAWEQAQAKSGARLHQEALEIYSALKRSYPNPPVGMDAIAKAIELQNRKLEQLRALKASFSVSVRHGHSFSFVPFTNRTCNGTLRADGFQITYQGSEPAHSFILTYENLRDINVGGGKVTIAGTGVPGGKIELEQADKNPTTTLAEFSQKIENYRKLSREYRQ